MHNQSFMYRKKHIILSIFVMVLIVLFCCQAIRLVKSSESPYLHSDIVMQMNSYGTKEQNAKLLSITDEHIKYNMGENLKINKTKTLMDLDDNTYTLFELNPIGYIIYHDASGRYVEYAENSPSPYLNIEGNLYYIGAMQYYFVDKEGLLQHTLKADLYWDKSELKTLQVESKRINTELIADKSNGVLDYINGDVVTIPAKEIKSKELAAPAATASIPMTSFFPKLESNYQIGYRGGGVCGYIALNMVIGYSALAFDYNIVPFEWMDKINNTMKGQILTDKLLVCGGENPNGNSFKGTTAIEIKKVAAKYFELPEVKNYHKWKINTKLFDVDGKKTIERGYPVILFGNLRTPTNGDKVNHAVVAYGVEQRGTKVTYRVHYGWEAYPSIYLENPLIGTDLWMEVI